jgi:hypothetical protein
MLSTYGFTAIGGYDSRPPPAGNVQARGAAVLEFRALQVRALDRQDARRESKGGKPGRPADPLFWIPMGCGSGAGRTPE